MLLNIDARQLQSVLKKKQLLLHFSAKAQNMSVEVWNDLYSIRMCEQ